MLNELNAGCWTDSQVRLMLEAVSRGAVSAVLEHEQEVPEPGGLQPPSPWSGVGQFPLGKAPQIDSGILMFRLDDGSNTLIGRARALTAGTRVIEMVDEVVEDNYLGTARIQLGEFATLTEDMDTVIASVEDRYNLFGARRFALLVTGTASSGMADATMLTKAATVPSGWTTSIYRLQHGTSTYDAAHPVAGVVLRAKATNGRILEQWFRRDDLPVPSGTTKIWMVHTTGSFSTVMTPLQVGKTWDVRTYRYRLTPCDAA